MLGTTKSDEKGAHSQEHEESGNPAQRRQETIQTQKHL